MLRFDLLGLIRLQAADGTEVEALLRQPKRLALLAYLVSPAPGTWHRRDTLTALFWPELDAARARSSLRNALYVLRHTLGDAAVLTRGDEEVAIDPAQLHTDLAEVWTAIRDESGETALALYRGELLSGLFTPGSQGFERWLEDERARLRREVARVGTQWAATLEHEHKLGDALAALRQVVAINPDDEPAVRRLMVLHESIGDRAGGLSVFEAFRSRMAEDFDATPAPETMEVMERLRRLAPPITETAARPEPAPRETPPARVPPAPSSAAPAPPPPAARRRTPTRTAAAAIVTIAALAVVVLALTHEPQPPLAIGTSVPVTSDEDLQIEPALSPNGRLVAYAKGTALRMRIMVQRLDGGQAVPLSGDSSAVELLPRWAPDNDRILFLARDGAYVSPAQGGSERLVVPGGAGDAMVRSASWSPDGDSVLIVRNDSLTVRPVDGVGFRFIGTGTQLHSCVWAPTRPWIACVSGNWIAFTPGPLFGNRLPSAIVLFPAAGGSAIQLTDNEHAYLSPAWSSDGRYLWVLTNRDGVPGDLDAIRVADDGSRSGSYVRLGLPNAESISLANDRLAYSLQSRKANVWAIPVPAHPPVTLTDAAELTSGNRVIEVATVSVDGAWLVFDSDLRGNADIYRMPLAGGPAERITDDPRPEFTGTLSPNDAELAYHISVDGKRRMFVRDLEAGTVKPASGSPGDWGVPRWSPSGTSLAAWSHEREEGAIGVVHRDPSGTWHTVWSLPDGQLPVWSPDGRMLAFVRLDGSVVTIPSDSGATRIIYAPRPASHDPIATYLAWHESDRIWLLGHDAAGRTGIWVLPLAGGAPTLLVDFGERVSGPSLSTDGHRFYFTLDQRISNVWWAQLEKR